MGYLEEKALERRIEKLEQSIKLEEKALDEKLEQSIKRAVSRAPAIDFSRIESALETFKSVSKNGQMMAEFYEAIEEGLALAKASAIANGYSDDAWKEGLRKLGLSEVAIDRIIAGLGR